MSDGELISKDYDEDSFHKHLLEQYKLFVGTSLDVTSKRLESNKFHLTLNSVVFGFASYMTVLNQYAVIILFSIIGILISAVWLKNILHACMDQYLGRYHGLTATEKFYPIIFILLYSVLIAFTVCSA